MILLLDLVVAPQRELEHSTAMSFYQAITTPSNANPPVQQFNTVAVDCLLEC